MKKSIVFLLIFVFCSCNQTTAQEQTSTSIPSKTIINQTTTTTTSTTTSTTTVPQTTTTSTSTTTTTSTTTVPQTTTTVPQTTTTTTINISSISQNFGSCYDGNTKRNSILSVTNNGSEQIDYIAEMKIDGGGWEYRGNHYLGIGQTNPTAADASVSVGSTITWRIKLYRGASEYYETNILGPSGVVSCP